MTTEQLFLFLFLSYNREIFTTRNNGMHTLLLMNKPVLCSSLICSVLIYLIICGQLLAVGSEGDEASGQVNQTADLQVTVGAAGGRGADCVCCTHHVAVTPLDTVSR